MIIKVELFTSNLCSKCKKAKRMLADLVAEMGEENFDLEFIDVVKNIDRSVEMGILRTPSLVINHRLISRSLPNRNELKTMLEKLFVENGQQQAVQKQVTQNT